MLGPIRGPKWEFWSRAGCGLPFVIFGTQSLIEAALGETPKVTRSTTRWNLSIKECRQLGEAALRTVVLLSIIALMEAGPVDAQTFYGTILGTVADASGGAIAGARVSLINSSTAGGLATQTDAAGNYRFLNLLPGLYKLDVEQTRFKHLTRDQVQVRVDNATRVDVSLELGEMTQSVEVISNAPLLQTESAALNHVVEGRQVQELPLNGRNVFNLVALVPGVVPLGSSQGSAVGNAVSGTGAGTNPGAFGNYSIGGGLAAQNSIFIDGVQDNLSGNNTPLVPTQDAIQEFGVATNDVDAEFGQFGGGIINMTTKTGTNSLHGGLYEYLRNKVLNANDFFNNRNGVPRPPFTQHQYGITLGGPVIRNKTFFFASWEGFALRTGIPSTFTVPTAAFRAGNFPGQPTIYDPLTTCGVGSNPTCPVSASGQPIMTRTPFPDNQIPAGRFDTTTLVMQKYWPLPNGLGTVNNYVLNFPKGANSNQMAGRLDHSFSDKQRLFARYSWWNVGNSPGDPFRNLTGINNYRLGVNQIVLGYTYAITPALIADFRGAYLRESFPSFASSIGTDMSQFGPAWASIGKQLPFTLYPAENITGGFRSLTASGQLNRNNDYFYTGSLMKIKGRHTIKFGGTFKRDLAANKFGAANSFNFDATFTSANATNSATSGAGFADFILGYPTTGQLGTVKEIYVYLNACTFYVMDTYQIHRRLTLNLGLRWDQPGSDGELNNSNVVLDLTKPDPAGAAAGLPNLVGQPVLVASPDHPSRLETQRHWDDFSPRVGFAWRATDSTVIRGGLGINYLPYLVGRYPSVLAAVNSATTSMVTTLDGGLTPYAVMSNPFPNGLLQPAGRNPGFLQTLEGGNVFGSIDGPDKYVMQWNFSVQRDLGHDAMVQVTYAASAGRHLAWTTGAGGGVNLNQIPDQYLTLGSALLNQVPNPFYGVLPASVGVLGQAKVALGYLLRPYPQFLSVQTIAKNEATSSYNSLQASFQKRFNQAGTIVANYTWSKLLSNTDTATGSMENDLSFGWTQDWNNRRADYSLAGEDVTQRLVVSYIYDLPFGKGKRSLSHLNRAADNLIGGWSMAGLTTFSSGQPLSITALANVLSQQFGASWPQFNNAMRPNVVAGCNAGMSGSAVSRLNEWFNAACYQQPGNFAFGNASRTDPKLRDEGIANFDFAISKSFALRENWNLLFRAEFFNLFNRERFGAPNTQVGNANFGVVTGTSPLATPRLVQFALRLKF